jgi:DNA mismatch endonuclease (patch repair protein)
MEKALRRKLPGGTFHDVSATTSKTMAAIAGKHAKTTERRFRMALVRAGVAGWILHSGDVVGKPDIYFPVERVAVFLDGCFWHGCPRCGHVPKTNRPFWKAKIARNQVRDRMATRRLRASGVSVVRIWEHELKEDQALADCILLVCRKLAKRS